MAVITPPNFLQGGSHDAQVMRLPVSALAGQDVETFANSVSAVGVAHGLVRDGHLEVSEKSGTPNMSVDVAKGYALITGDSSLAQGAYAFANDATVNLAIATADATNPRWDLVVAQVRDNTEDAGGNDDARLTVVTGTPAASPADPSIPDGCLVLARVVVAASVSSIVNANITMLAGLARGSAWNQAWGVVASASKTSNQGSITTLTDVTGMSVTFTAVSGRRYLTTLELLAISTVAADFYESRITDGSNVLKQLSTVYIGNLSSSIKSHLSVLESGLSGSVTRKARVARIGTGTLTVSADATYPSQIVVYDVGPA